jgi:sugar phosphate isomerase/epimerase
MFRIGLNPYGLSYTLGIFGKGTARAIPEPMPLCQYVELAIELDVCGVEIDGAMALAVSEAELSRVQQRIEERSLWCVLASGAMAANVEDVIDLAPIIGARCVRLALTPVLCGDRAAQGPRWDRCVAEARALLARAAARASARGSLLAIENHQDFTSHELLELCEEAGDNVGVCLDTANPLAVGEDPIEFARRVAPRLRHVHLKDYRARFSDEGFRLVRCAVGDGAIPFAELYPLLAPLEVTAAIECGSLETRHVRLLTDAWWRGYPAHSAAELVRCLNTARKRAFGEDESWQTPWERDASAQAIAEYELSQIKKSVSNLRTLGYA